MVTAGTSEYKSDFARRYYRQDEANGEVNGTRRMLLVVLFTRGIEIPDEMETRIDDCDDLGQLESWVRRAVTAEFIGDLFA